MIKNTTLKIQSIPFKWLFRASLMMFFLGTFQRAQSQDVGVTSIISPMSPMCAVGNQSVLIRIKNYAADTIKYDANNVVVTVKVTGASTQTFKDTLSMGNLAADSIQDITVTVHCNLSVAGTHIFEAYTDVTGDANTLNDTLAADSIIVKPLPTAVITAYDSLTFCQGGSCLLYTSPSPR